MFRRPSRMSCPRTSDRVQLPMHNQAPVYSFSKIGGLLPGEVATIRVAPWDSSNLGNYNAVKLDVEALIPGLTLFSVRLFEFPNGTGQPFAFAEVQNTDRSAPVPPASLHLVDDQTTVTPGQGVVLRETFGGIQPVVMRDWILPRGPANGREWVVSIMNNDQTPNAPTRVFSVNLTLTLLVRGSL